MQPFSTHTGIVATLDRANVDTDQIIPKQFLKSIRRTGFGESLFFDWRYLEDGSPDPAFELNAPHLQGATILVTRNNFGCGSSREHAVWAVAQYGFRVVIAPSRAQESSRIPAFADIFRNNCVKNGLLTVELTETDVETIFQQAALNKSLKATVDLPRQKVTLDLASPLSFRFDIDAGVKDYLMRGLDDIGQTMQHLGEIQAFEKKHILQMPSRA